MEGEVGTNREGTSHVLVQRNDVRVVSSEVLIHVADRLQLVVALGQGLFDEGVVVLSLLVLHHRHLSVDGVTVLAERLVATPDIGKHVPTIS